MADGVKTVRGTLGGATVETSEANVERLGSAFTAEKATAKKAAAKPAKSDEK